MLFTTTKRLLAKGPSASEGASVRRLIRLLAAFGSPFALAAALAVASIAPGDVEVDLPVYGFRAPADRLNERWSYRFSWSGFPVATAAITAENAPGPAKAMSITVQGRTVPFIDLFWKYRLDARGVIRTDPFSPGTYTATELAGALEKETRIEFDERRRVKTYRRKGERVREYEFDGKNTLDILATTFLALHLDYTQGAEYRFDTLTGTARYLVTVRAEAREPVRAAGKPHDAWRLKIVTRELTNPREERRHVATELWVSAERPRRLLKARSRTFVGSVVVDLVGVEPRNPSVLFDS